MELISRADAIKDAESWVAVDEHERRLQKNVIEWLKEFPPAEPGTNLAEVGMGTISRQQAIDALTKDKKELEHIINKMNGHEKEFDRFVGQRNQVDYDIYAIERLPPAEPKREERKIGEWIYDWGDWDFETCKCSECGNHVTTPIEKRYSFCPNCGADMREVTT